MLLHYKNIKNIPNFGYEILNEKFQKGILVSKEKSKNFNWFNILYIRDIKTKKIVRLDLCQSGTEGIIKYISKQL